MFRRLSGPACLTPKAPDPRPFPSYWDDRDFDTAMEAERVDELKSGRRTDENVERCRETRVNDVPRHHRECLVSGHSERLSRDIVDTSTRGGGRCRWLGWWWRRSGSRGDR